jgi:hypothetical protein
MSEQEQWQSDPIQTRKRLQNLIKQGLAQARLEASEVVSEPPVETIKNDAQSVEAAVSDQQVGGKAELANRRKRAPAKYTSKWDLEAVRGMAVIVISQQSEIVEKVSEPVQPGQEVPEIAQMTTELAEPAEEIEAEVAVGSTDEEPLPELPDDADETVIEDDQLDERRKKAPVLDKTKLDIDAVRDMANKAISEQEDKLREEIEARPVEPLKQFQEIDKYRPAASCEVTWEEMSGSGCVKFCERCKLQVYDFSSMELPEAEKLIFKQEGTKTFTLYKRTDGKFLTRNCPLGIARKRTRILLVSGLSIAAICLLFAAVTAPKAQKDGIKPTADEKPVKASHVSDPTLVAAGQAQERLRMQRTRKAMLAGVDVQTPDSPEAGDMPADPNSKAKYPAAHNPKESSTVSISDLPQLPNLPKYPASDTKVLKTVYHPYLAGGKQCYEQSALCKGDGAGVMSWYRTSLEKEGWHIEPGQAAVNTAARRPEDGTIVFVHVSPSSGEGYRSQISVRYIRLPARPQSE